MGLDEKLARWAGFTFDDNWSAHNPYTTPDGIVIHNWTPFTESLDACFKWLVPQIEGLEEIKFLFEQKGLFCEITVWKRSKEFIYSNQDYEKTPALALCMAIEQLIDKENNDRP